MDTQKLKQYIETLVQRGTTPAEIARKSGLSDATISQFRSGKYGAKEDNVATKLAAALNYYDNAWIVVDSVTSYRQIQTSFTAAKRNSKWFCISSRSGSGKTQPLIDLYNTNSDKSVVYLKCRKWTAHKFLVKLATCLGISITRYMDNDDLLDVIIQNFNQMGGMKPLLMLDDIGKLTHSAICTLIPLYDDTLNRLGLLASGTETFARNIKRYVGRIEGYDEIDGRFKRNYISLLGASKKDVYAICAANGVTDKDKQEEIWGKLDKRLKEPVEGSGKKYYFCDDLRELAGMIENEQIREQMGRGELA